MMVKNFGILNDENDIVLIKDNFRTKEEAEKYAKENNLIGEYYFIIELDELVEK